MVHISLTVILFLAVGSTTYAGALTGKTINQSKLCVVGIVSIICMQSFTNNI